MLSSKKLQVFNLIGLLKHVQSRKVNSKSRIIKSGFTLVELAMVIVIIGLIVGGILVGNDLISAAQVRATISQYDQYSVATNTFKLRFGYLPGDISEPTASAFGFVARGSSAGQGDGNGAIKGYNGGACGWVEGAGETLMFWVDLSTAELISGKFSAASPTALATISKANLPLYFPTAKLGNGNYFYVYNRLPV